MSVNLAASPTGSRVGISTVRLGPYQVMVTVSPKAWRPLGHQQFVLEGGDWSGHRQIGLYETERLHVRGTDDVEALIWQLLRGSRQVVDGGPSWDSSMLVPDTPPHPSIEPEPLPIRDLHKETASLLRLFGRVNLLPTTAEQLSGTFTTSPLHQPLTHRRFIDEVRARLDTLRPGYRNVTEVRSTVRGRIDPTSLAAWQSGIGSGLRCHYSELTLSTHLLACICAALEWIADGRGVGSLLPGEFSDLRLRHDAVTLRRALLDVKTLSPSEALHVGRGLRLGRLDRAWADALSLAVAVLAQREATAAAARVAAVDALELSVPTDKLWESIVHEALRRSGFDQVIPQAHAFTSDPWVVTPAKRSHTYPDNVARAAQDVYIIDAKYKRPDSRASPNRDDQYQMFAYSYLVRDLPRQVRAAVLAYPGNAAKAKWTRGRDESARPVELFAVFVPFPTPGEIESSTAWNTYLDRAATKLADDLNLVARSVSRISA
jgi:5-methylcytosine-specific restriction endonuclease McrBC regulatory subunit McrC